MLLSRRKNRYTIKTGANEAGNALCTWPLMDVLRELLVGSARVVPVWFSYGSRMAPVWFPYGSRVVPVWFPYGSCMVSVWFPYGSRMVPVILPNTFIAQTMNLLHFHVNIYLCIYEHLWRRMGSNAQCRLIGQKISLLNVPFHPAVMAPSVQS